MAFSLRHARLRRARPSCIRVIHTAVPQKSSSQATSAADSDPWCGILQPVVLERIPSEEATKPGGGCAWVHTKALYRLTQESQAIMRGCSDEMCSTSAMLTGVRVSDWIEED